MGCDELYDKSVITEDALICGKILLSKIEWELSYICDFCHKNVPTISKLLRHVLNQHVEDLPLRKLREMCAPEVDVEFIDPETLIADPLEGQQMNRTRSSALLNESKGGENDDEPEIDINLEFPSLLRIFKGDRKSIGNIENSNDRKTFLSLLTTFEENTNDKKDVDFILDAEREHEMMQKILKEQLDQYRQQQKNVKNDNKNTKDNENEDKDYDDGNNDDDGSNSTTSTELDTEEGENEINGNFDFASVSQKVLTETISKHEIKCAVCLEQFYSRRQLSVHRKTHGDRPFICMRCGARFADKRDFITHIYRHDGIRPYSCQLCAKTFRSPGTLQIHMRFHTGKKPYKCTECDKRFTSNGQLHAHVRRHKNIRRHLCPICGKAFYESDQLNDHLARHSSERPHKCQQCNASFAVAKGLRQHMLVHSEVKKYSCKFCEKKFAQSSGVNSHMKHVHKNERENKTSTMSINDCFFGV